MKSLSHKTLLATSFILFVVVAIGYGYVYRTIGLSVENITGLRSSIQQGEILRSQAKSISTLYDDTLANRKALKAAVINSEKAVALIEAVESLSIKSSAKVTILNINSQKTGQGSSIANEIYMDVSVTGSWASVMKTLNEAEKLAFVSAIDHVRVDVGDKRVWSMTLKLRALTI